MWAFSLRWALFGCNRFAGLPFEGLSSWRVGTCVRCKHRITKGCDVSISRHGDMRFSYYVWPIKKYPRTKPGTNRTFYILHKDEFDMVACENLWGAIRIRRHFVFDFDNDNEILIPCSSSFILFLFLWLIPIQCSSLRKLRTWTFNAGCHYQLIVILIVSSSSSEDEM